MTRWMLGAALVLAGTAAAETVDVSGTYTIASPEGSLTLTLEQAPHSTVAGTCTISATGDSCEVSGELTIDEDDEWVVEGGIACAAGRSDFELSADEDGAFQLFLVPYDGTDTPRLDLSVIWTATRGPTAIDPSNPPTSPHPGLSGVWATQVIVNGADGSMVSQLFMELRPDGTLVDLGSRAMASIPGVSIDGDVGEAGDVASWRTQDNVLEVSYAGSRWVALATFELAGNRLLLIYYDGDRALWYRQ